MKNEVQPWKFRMSMACGQMVILSSLICLVIGTRPAAAWGPRGHEIVNELAADALPHSSLRELFEQHRQYLAAHSSDPDQWRSISSSEGFHHYLDADRYGKSPFLDLPRSRVEAERRYGAAAVRKNGVVPWSVEQWFLTLVEAFRTGDRSKALLAAAILGHYAADSHVPFHAVENYDGQLTGQRGIHARFETMLVDRYVKENELRPSGVRYIDDPARSTVGWIVESAELVPEVLSADREVHAKNPDYESASYRAQFWQAVGPIVIRRLEEASGDLASLWYSAWLVAGKPDVSGPCEEILDTAAAAGVPHDRAPLRK